MAKNFKHNDEALIAEIARPIWEKLVKHNQKRHPERVIDNNTLHRSYKTLGQEFTFGDFCDEIRLELQNDDARN